MTKKHTNKITQKYIKKIKNLRQEYLKKKEKCSLSIIKQCGVCLKFALKGCPAQHVAGHNITSSHPVESYEQTNLRKKKLTN